MQYQPKKAVALFHQVKDPDDVTFILLFNACAKIADDEALQVVRTYSSNLSTLSMSNVRLKVSLMDALIKCGDCDAAVKIFEKTEKSVVSYANLMNGFNNAKQPEKTLSLYEELKRNGITANESVCLLVIQALSQIKIGRLVNDIVHEMPKKLMMDTSIQNSLIGMWVSFLRNKFNKHDYLTMNAGQDWFH